MEVNALIEKQIPILEILAKKYQRFYNCDDKRREAFQNGAVGLVMAAHRYNPSMGCEFGAYCSKWMKGKILNGRGNAKERGITDASYEIKTRMYYADGIDEKAEAVACPGKPQDIAVYENELAKDVRSAIESLTERQRNIMKLIVYQELNCAQVAERLNCNPSNIVQIYARARAILRAKLWPYKEYSPYA